MSRLKALLTVDEITDRCEMEPNSGCWLWCGAVNSLGYPFVVRRREGRRRHISVTRTMLSLKTGHAIPFDAEACHRCDTPSCVNPDHLFIGSHRDNMGDASAKGRTARGERSGPAKLTAQAVMESRLARPHDLPEMAKRLGVSLYQLKAARNGKQWKWITDVPPVKRSPEEIREQCRQAGRLGGLVKTKPKRGRQ